jgi:hypothetical protein
MLRLVFVLMLAVATVASSQTSPPFLSVCDLSKDFAAYRDQVIAVRGVYYYGLRQTCTQKCAEGPWPSFLDLTGGDGVAWNALAKVEHTVELEAKKGKRLEIWVTAVGQLGTGARRSPCDQTWRHEGYGHLSSFPAQLVVKHFLDIEVKVNPESPYDYSHMYHGAL